MAAVTSTASPASAAGCRDGDRQHAADAAATGNFITVQTVEQWGRQISLRYIRGARCGWGLISNGSDGDLVWIERNTNPGNALSLQRIRSGNRSTFTGVFDDAGMRIRACGKAGNRIEVKCTIWF
jgi:hypothetical protein